jgi:hypothetical protein
MASAGKSGPLPENGAEIPSLRRERFAAAGTSVGRLTGR